MCLLMIAFSFENAMAPLEFSDVSVKCPETTVEFFIQLPLTCRDAERRNEPSNVFREANVYSF